MTPLAGRSPGYMYNAVAATFGGPAAPSACFPISMSENYAPGRSTGVPWRGAHRGTRENVGGLMNQKIAIRTENGDDVSAITEVTVAAFETLEISHHTEQFIIAALRAANALAVSLVAEADGRVIGHIAFSPVAISDGTRDWYGLGPVSVLPEYQRQGIGKALIKEGLSRLKDVNAHGCCLVGHPDYYRKFGFKNTPGLGVEGVPQEVFFALSFDGHIPQGTVSFHDAFKANG
jgi:putative acetyltransferase